MATIRPLTVALEGQKVQVYRNLNNGLLSVMQDGRVVGHVASVNLLNVTFKVRRGGRQRVLTERRKNVHAFAQGIFTEARQPGTEAVTYCPYTAAHFYRRADASPVYEAAHARLADGTVFI